MDYINTQRPEAAQRHAVSVSSPGSRRPSPTRAHSTLWRTNSARRTSTERPFQGLTGLGDDSAVPSGVQPANYEDLEGGYAVPARNPLSRRSTGALTTTLGVREEGNTESAKCGAVTPVEDVIDHHIVTWDSFQDPTNPKNWPKHKKWIATVLVSGYSFISPVSSTMLAPALPTLQAEFGITSDLQTYLLMSIFLLAYAVGPFVLAPLSEMHGRVVVLQSSNLLFLLFNTVCGWSTTTGQMLAFRFLSGLGGSAPQALGGGVLSDCWRAEERGRATAIYSLAPFLGPAIGPIAAGYLTQYLNWRWIFWTVSIADAVLQILAFLFLSETYAPKILLRKARHIRKETGDDRFRTEFENPDRTFAQTLRKHQVRPFKMLFTEPALQVTALYRAYLYGLMYLVLASFPSVWMKQYKQKPGPASLNYISLGVGFVLGLQVAGPMIDKVYANLQRRYNHPGRPEFRIPLMYPTAIVVPAGLLTYGLAANFRAHWIVPNIGAAIFAAGLIQSFQCVQTYTIDTYERYAASATGAAAFVRTMAGFSFPLFAPGLYDRMGILVGNGILSGVAFVLGMVVPTLMWRYGAWLRSKSNFCESPDMPQKKAQDNTQEKS